MANAPAVLDGRRPVGAPPPSVAPEPTPPGPRPSLADVERRRVELWTVSVFLVMGVTALLALLWGARHLLPEVVRPSTGATWVAGVLVAGLAFAFLLYVGEKERSLRRLTRLLIEERVRATALERSVETERATVARLEELDRLKNDFVAMVSHDLRTPLTAIIGAARTVERKGATMDPQQHQVFMNVIQRQADRLLRLVEDVLTASQMEAVQPTLERCLVNLRELIDDLVEDLSHTEVGSDRTVLVTVEPADAEIWADRGALEQILSNLVENALKYSREEVRVKGIVRTGETVVEVADRGPGMTPEQLATIFERFRQLSPGGRAEKGFGLGLFIVKNLVEAHNGRVDVWSEPGVGTRFTVYLPQRAAPR